MAGLFIVHFQLHRRTQGGCHAHVGTRSGSSYARGIHGTHKGAQKMAPWKQRGGHMPLLPQYMDIRALHQWRGKPRLLRMRRRGTAPGNKDRPAAHTSRKTKQIPQKDILPVHHQQESTCDSFLQQEDKKATQRVALFFRLHPGAPLAISKGRDMYNQRSVPPASGDSKLHVRQTSPGS